MSARFALLVALFGCGTPNIDSGDPPRILWTSVEPGTAITVGADGFFLGVGADDLDGDAVTFTWRYNDGTTPSATSTEWSSEAELSHAAVEAGASAVTCTVSDPDGDVAVTWGFVAG